MEFDEPAHDFTEPFRVYANYFEDLAGYIGGQFGLAESVADGVYTAVAARAPGKLVQRRPLARPSSDIFQACMRKSWGFLRRAQREVADEEFYDTEANAYLPYQCYYAVYHAGLAFAVASRQRRPRSHNAALALLAKEVQRGMLPLPWRAWCEGCPQTGRYRLGGIAADDPIHALSAPDPATTERRLAMLLRTTRETELERRFAQERQRQPQPGRTRRNVSTSAKDSWAAKVHATTLFDVFYRARLKSSYDEADVFVLGARDEVEARRFGQALVIVTDASVAALEALMSLYIGPRTLAEAAEAYAERTYSTLIAKRRDIWAKRIPGRGPTPFAPGDADIPF